MAKTLKAIQSRERGHKKKKKNVLKCGQEPKSNTKQKRPQEEEEEVVLVVPWPCPSSATPSGCLATTWATRLSSPRPAMTTPSSSGRRTVEYVNGL